MSMSDNADSDDDETDTDISDHIKNLRYTERWVLVCIEYNEPIRFEYESKSGPSLLQVTGLSRGGLYRILRTLESYGLITTETVSNGDDADGRARYYRTCKGVDAWDGLASDES